MKIFADLHIHSKHSRACSTSMDIEHIAKYSKIKGLNLVGTGDFTHPIWIKELKEKLIDLGKGIFQDKIYNQNFVLQTEISLVYTQNKKGRRVHLVVLAPSFEIVDKITNYLLKRGRIDYDGRPIFNISCRDFTKDILEISNNIEIIPAHIWTPWFGLFGSKSGFDSVKECFGDQADHIHSLETGLSADPEMFWRVSSLDKYTILSSSDCHSFWPWRIGREATIFEFDKITYENLINAIRTKKGYIGTIEVDPAYGKYHFDGHRNCNISYSPEESKKHNKLCPVCGKPLIIGVLARVEVLADRLEKYKLTGAAEYKRLIPLIELLSFARKKGITSKNIQTEYFDTVSKFNNEFEILLNVSEKDLKLVFDEQVVELILKNRTGKIEVVPGYDGVYGVIKPDNSNTINKKNIENKKVFSKYQKQRTLE
ncbi:MAG: DNA helicase UvrD [Candidatus Huberarchaeum crystalense]|uniref:DNA helicase UvrD n=1 Tax=Huberarchaeum crystalense TaxID=2014257 RepID=A0A2G9LKH1_HUBC1|nr:MAG: DNA helicase UvrD [Candidatus Huberarchaeum crystalense]